MPSGPEDDDHAALLGLPGTVGSPVGAREHDSVAIRITQPDLPVIGPAIALGRIAVARQNNFRLERLRTRRCRIEVRHLEPEQHAVAVRKRWIADLSVMMCHVPAMQLEDEPITVNEAFVVRTAVIAPYAEEPLIPAAAGLDIAYADQWLWPQFDHRGRAAVLKPPRADGGASPSCARGVQPLLAFSRYPAIRGCVGDRFSAARAARS
jgi:hypothetical protein